MMARPNPIIRELLERNAGNPTITVFSDGTYVIHGARDAEIDQRCNWGNAPKPIVSVDLTTLEPVVAPDLRRRTRLYEMMFGKRAVRDEGGDNAHHEAG